MWEINIICLICHCLKFSVSAARLEMFFCEIKINFNDFWCQLNRKKNTAKENFCQLFVATIRENGGLNFLPSEQEIKLIDKNVARCRNGMGFCGCVGSLFFSGLCHCNLCKVENNV